MDSALQSPLPSREDLKKLLVGKKLSELPTPIALVDRHVAAINYPISKPTRYSYVISATNLDFKSIEVTRLQMGDDLSNDLKHVNLIVSTVREAEFLKEYLLECKQQGRTVNVLYGMPVPPSNVDRLAKLGQSLGQGSIGLLVDNISQLESLKRFRKTAGFGPYITFKIDTGYHRAGIPPTSKNLEDLVRHTIEAEKNGLCKIHGVYSHSGHSYYTTSPEENMACLLEEIQKLSEGALLVKKLLSEEKEPRRMIMSVGATPSCSSVAHLLGPPTEHNQSPTATKLREALQDVLSKGLSIELHAGNYPFLDMQQLYTQASPSVFTNQDQDQDSQSLITQKDIAYTVLAEVASTYALRSPPQALIAAGTLALGHEPYEGYSSWAMISDWGLGSDKESRIGHGDIYSGWDVVKVSQEHGMLQRSMGSKMQAIMQKAGGDEVVNGLGEMPFAVGQKVRVWPNHCCVSAAGFGFYAVVDSNEDPERVVDVWIRCNGW